MFEPITDSRLPESIVKQTKRLIATGALKPGDCLPGERQLMRQLAVSRSSLRQAIQALEATGYVKVIPGKGTFIKTATEKTGLLMESLILPWAVRDEKLLNELLEVRLIFEVEAASLAAERANENGLASIRSELEYIIRAQSGRQINEMVSANIAFHRSIAQATGNSLMVTLTDSIAATMREFTTFALSITGGTPDSVEEHKKIYAAIASGNSVAARSEARKHLGGVKNLFKIYLTNIESELNNPDLEPGIPAEV